jgi:peptidoglycan/xylan/chitin deacetylase (PgdA/CDA1 family)
MRGFRADRAATLWFFHPLRRLTRTATGRIPILMYHSVSDLDESERGPYYRIGTSPRVFEEQLRFLGAHGYRSIGLHQAVGMIEGTVPGPEKPVVLTFDDGYQDFYTQAFPRLVKFGYSATVFLPTAYIGDAARPFKGLECLTWGQVRELQRAGVEFGSHTVTHPQLRTLQADDVRDELCCSKQTIEQELGCPVRSFSYPYAFPETDRQFKQTLRATLEKSGYENGVSTILGTAGRGSDPFFLERLPVNSGDEARFFKAKMEGAYDWLHAPQFAAKLLTNRAV